MIIFDTELFVYSVFVFVCWTEISTRLSMQKKEGVGSGQLSEQTVFFLKINILAILIKYFYLQTRKHLGNTPSSYKQ